MKIRNGFVSNSSSSSFILIFDKKPKTFNRLKEMMFPDESSDHMFKYDDKTISIREIVYRVFTDIEKRRKANNKELLKEFCDYSYQIHDKDVMKIEKIFDQKIAANKRVLETEMSKYPKLFDDIHPIVLADANIKLIKKIFKCLTSLKHALLNKNNKDKIIRIVSIFKLKEPHFFIDKQSFDKIIHCYKIHSSLQDELWAREDDIRNKKSEINFHKFKEKYKNKWHCILQYADENGDGLLEHGNIFKHIEHIRISHH